MFLLSVPDNASSNIEFDALSVTKDATKPFAPTGEAPEFAINHFAAESAVEYKLGSTEPAYKVALAKIAYTPAFVI